MLTRRFAKAKHLMQAEGPWSVIRSVSSSIWLRSRLRAMAHKKSVELDGCTFSLRSIPDSFTKLFLLTNRYELPERRAVVRHLRRDLPVIELGGALGVVACITNKLLEDPTSHVVVEANPLAIAQLKLNKESNHCGFEIVNRAIAYGVDTVTFSPAVDLAGTSIDADGTQLEGTERPVTVEATQLGKLVGGHGFGRFSLVCDIEGKEYDLVCHEIEVLKSADAIIMETHARIIGEEKIKLMMNKLTDIGFEVVQEDDYVITLRQVPAALKQR
jgi:FkbM family methyltransferase